MQIIKSPSKRGSMGSVQAIPIENTASAILEASLKDYRQYQYSKMLPYKDDALDLKMHSIDFSGVIQPIVLEFDHDTLDHQRERAEVLASHLQTPIWYVFSGNKSHHIYIWFENFANTPEEYKEKCWSLYWWACEEFPDYFYYALENKLVDNPNVPQEQLKNIPDKNLFNASYYARQAGGRRVDEK
ncbi:hypothetical protein HQ531_12190 [bacterium]|nr:hypothetical protein [bacterium]